MREGNRLGERRRRRRRLSSAIDFGGVERGGFVADQTGGKREAKQKKSAERRSNRADDASLPRPPAAGLSADSEK